MLFLAWYIGCVLFVWAHQKNVLFVCYSLQVHRKCTVLMTCQITIAWISFRKCTVLNLFMTLVSPKAWKSTLLLLIILFYTSKQCLRLWLSFSLFIHKTPRNPLERRASICITFSGLQSAPFKWSWRDTLLNLRNHYHWNVILKIFKVLERIMLHAQKVW